MSSGKLSRKWLRFLSDFWMSRFFGKYFDEICPDGSINVFKLAEDQWLNDYV
jgi:hypothetical protein